MLFSLKLYSENVNTWNILIASIFYPLGMSDDLVGFGMNVDDGPGIWDIEGKYHVEYGQSKCSVIYVLKVLDTV